MSFDSGVSATVYPGAHPRDCGACLLAAGELSMNQWIMDIAADEGVVKLCDGHYRDTVIGAHRRKHGL